MISVLDLVTIQKTKIDQKYVQVAVMKMVAEWNKILWFVNTEEIFTHKWHFDYN